MNEKNLDFKDIESVLDCIDSELEELQEEKSFMAGE